MTVCKAAKAPCGVRIALIVSWVNRLPEKSPAAISAAVDWGRHSCLCTEKWWRYYAGFRALQ